jgi:hypothetical protein
VYRSRALRRRRSALAVLGVAALALLLTVIAEGGRPKSELVRYDRRAAVEYADTWALKFNPEYWSSPDQDCANFVSQCLAAGGLRPIYDAGRAWHSNGTQYPTVAWVNCGAQKRALSARGAAHTRYIVRATRRQPARWSAGDIVYLGNVVDGRVEWQHVIICAGKRGGEWVYDSHTAAHRRVSLALWYPAHFSEIRFCSIADRVRYTGG